MKQLVGNWPAAACGLLTLHLDRRALIQGGPYNAPNSYRWNFDAMGNLPAGSAIWGNDELMPNGTEYLATIFNSYGDNIWGPQRMMLCGDSPVDISQWVPPCLEPGAPAISVSISPGSGTLFSGETLQFTATVTNSADQTVIWSASAGSIDANGLFTAPSGVSSATTITITATPAADPTASGSVTVTVNAEALVAVTVLPLTATLTAGQTLQFSASVANSMDQRVTWMADFGTIDANGLFTAPTVFNSTSVVITAVSVIDGTKSGAVHITVNPGVLPTQLDLLQWCVLSSRATQHLAGDPSQPYEVQWLDTDTGYPSNYPAGTLWFIKNIAGNPWDICFYDNNHALAHWITENGDTAYQAQCQAANGTACWNYARAYKRNTRTGGIAVLPRYFTPGNSVTLDSPAPNYVVRTADCEATSDQINLGDVRCITTGPFKISWGGSIDKGSGTLATGPNYDNVNGVDTIKNEYYYSGSFNGGFSDHEDTYYVLGFGRVAWYYYHSNAFVQKTVNNIVVAGGHPQPNFPCGPGKPWFGGGAVTPPPPPVPGANFSNLETKSPGWVVAGGTSVGGTDATPAYSMLQNVPWQGHTNTLQLMIHSAASKWGNVRASFPTAATQAQLPLPPDGLVTLSGMVWLTSVALANVSFDTVIGKSNVVYHMGLEIDYNQGGMLMIQNSAGAWVSTGILVGILPMNTWNTFKVEMSLNTAAQTATRIALTLNGTRYVIPSNVASLTGKSTPWGDGNMVQLGIGTDSTGAQITAYYVNIGYTYG